MELKEMRTLKNLTQKEASILTGIPLRTYKNYENDKKKVGTLKYNYLSEKLQEYGFINEEHGILTLKEIKETCSKIFSEYSVQFCYLFGSYAKGNANEKSDIDLLISTEVTGIKFYGIIERLRSNLKKKIDLLTVKGINGNTELINEIFKDGIKIYG